MKEIKSTLTRYRAFMCVKYCLLFLFGFFGYMIMELLFRGYTYFTMGVLGGITILLLDKLNSKISWDMDLFLQGCIGSALITTMELIVGEYIKINRLQEMWNYSNVMLNFDGVICLPYSLLWIIVSLFAIFVADSINYYLFDEQPVPHYKLFGKTVLTFKEKEKRHSNKKQKK